MIGIIILGLFLIFFTFIYYSGFEENNLTDTGLGTRDSQIDTSDENLKLNSLQIEYVELNELLENKEDYVEKKISTSGDVIYIYYMFGPRYYLFDMSEVNMSAAPSGGLELSYHEDLQKFVLYDFSWEREYVLKENAPPLGVSIEGTIIYRGEVTDVANYYLNVSAVKEFEIYN